MCQPEDRFYLALNPHYGANTKNGLMWFLRSPMDKNKLGQLAKVMSVKAGLTARHVNHSARKTCITKILDAKTPPTEVAQLSGYKNLLSLNHYNTVNLQRQIEMSTTVHGGSGDSLTRSSANSFPEGQSANFNINNRGDAIVEPVASTSGNDSDEELVQASQHIEDALSAISDFENSQNNAGSTINGQTIIYQSDKAQADLSN